MKKVILRDYFIRRMSALTESGKERTASNYKSAWRAVERYLDTKADSFMLEDVTASWVKGYVQYLREERCLSAGSIDCYLRNLHAVCRHAADARLIRWGPGDDPFDGVKVKVPPTVKRTLDVSDICILSETASSHNLHGLKRVALDVFLFLFYARGMCFIDLYKLKKTDISGGYINYSRSKTGNPIRVKIEHELEQLITRYAEKDDPYVFPILQRKVSGDHGKICASYSLKRVNRHLKALGVKLGIGVCLTSYVARHSWASQAEANSIPTTVISQGLGHSSERVTHIYMKGMPSQVLDKANECVLNATVRRQSCVKKIENEKCPFLCKKGTLYDYRFDTT